MAGLRAERISQGDLKTLLISHLTHNRELEERDPSHQRPGLVVNPRSSYSLPDPVSTSVESKPEKKSKSNNEYLIIPSVRKSGRSRTKPSRFQDASDVASNDRVEVATLVEPQPSSNKSGAEISSNPYLPPPLAPFQFQKFADSSEPDEDFFDEFDDMGSDEPERKRMKTEHHALFSVPIVPISSDVIISFPSMQEDEVAGSEAILPSKRISPASKKADSGNDVLYVGASLNSLLAATKGPPSGPVSPTADIAKDDKGVVTEEFYTKELYPEVKGQWLKYGQKKVKGIVREYFKCYEANCPAKKQVETLVNVDKSVEYHTSFFGNHDHIIPEYSKHNAVIMHQQEFITTITEAFAEEVDVTQSASSVIAAENAKGKKKRELVRKLEVEVSSSLVMAKDGFKWRKYGQKLYKGGTEPRAYFKCCIKSCPARKTVEVAREGVKLCIYQSNHTHPVAYKKFDPAGRNESEDE